VRENPKFPPLIGYARVSKADGLQVLDLQCDALIAAGVAERHIYNDITSGKIDNRPGLASCLRSRAWTRRWAQAEEDACETQARNYATNALSPRCAGQIVATRGRKILASK
jgi:predicted site-specific integrase-resolvase